MRNFKTQLKFCIFLKAFTILVYRDTELWFVTVTRLVETAQFDKVVDELLI